MRTSRLIVAVVGIILVGVAVGKGRLAAQGPKGAPLEPPAQVSTEEGPFGGPPPPTRGEKRGFKCKTTPGVCTLEPPRPIGDPRNPRVPFNMLCWCSVLRDAEGCHVWWQRLIEANAAFRNTARKH